MLIQILKWAKHNPRADYKSMPWFKCMSGLYRDRRLFKLTIEAKWSFVTLLCLAAEENKAGLIDVDLEWLAEQIGVAETQAKAALEALERKGVIAVTYVTRTAPVGARSLHNEENEENITETREEPTLPAAPAPSLEEFVNLPNPPPADWDTKAAAWLQKAIVLHNPNAKPPPPQALIKWADVFGQLRVDFGETAVKELLLRIFEPDHPDFIVDPFWRINIQSPRDLRKHWNRITAQINNPKPKQGYAI
jgi:hypothetical protein